MALRVPAVALLVAVLVSTAAPVSAQSPSPSPEPTASGAPVGVPLAIDPLDLVAPIEASGLTEQDVADADARLMALLLEQSSLADALDPEALAMVTAMLTGAGAGETSRAEDAVAAVVRSGYAPVQADVGVRGSVIATLAAAAALQAAIDGGYERGGTDEPPAIRERGEVVENGIRTRASTRSSVRVSKAGSKVVVDATSTLDGTQTDVATGAQVGRFSQRAQIHAEVDGCPDADGVATMTLGGEMTVDATGMPGGGGFSIALDQTRRGHVGEDAYLRSIDDTQDLGVEMAPPGGGPVRSASVQGTLSQGRTADGGIDPATVTGRLTVQDNPGGFTDAEITGSYRAIAALLGFVSETAFDRAQAKWRDGACVRIESTEGSNRDVQPSEKLTFSAKPVHRVEGTELEKQLVGSLAGKGELDPADTPQDAPASLTYTAADEEGKSGTVTLTSTSNRGIGTLATTFRVNPGRYELKATGDFTVTSLLPFADLKGKIAARVRDITPGGGDHAGEGRVTVEVELVFQDPRLQACTLRTEAAAGKMVVASAKSAPEAKTVRIKLDVRDQIDRLRMKCGGATQMVALEGGGGLGHFWSEPLAEVVFPLEGGRKRVSGSKSFPAGWQSQVKGTLTLRKQRS